MNKSMYSLSLPREMMDETKRVAKKEGISILQFILSCIKFGLEYYKMRKENPDTNIIFRQTAGDTRVLWL